ncbi:PTS sugar transporter subunit IIC [Spiroplasma clarkii]|uniref:PTS sugar transporter subunit IIC n=1 Tax=Spiroplasma clarkii TaxID=2139 RepID=UPI0011BA7955|nr:PTS transporter subunit EIIC [Spiroplasma clarkii]
MIEEYHQEFQKNINHLYQEFEEQHPQIKRYKYKVRKFINHKLKPFKNDNERSIYELSIEVLFLANQLKSKIEYQHKRVVNAKLELRYNKGKTDVLPFKVYLERFAKDVNKFSNWKFIAALRNGFFALMPLIIAGAIFVIINNTFISPEYGGFLNLFSFSVDTLENLQKVRDIGENIYNAGFAFYALLLAGAIAYNLAPHYNSSRWSMMLLAMGCYIVVNPIFITDIKVMGTSGLLTAVLVSIFSSVIYGNLSKNERLKINLDKNSVPDGVIRSFNVLVPFAITLIVFALIEFIISFVGYNVGEIQIQGSYVSVNSLNQIVVIVLQLPLTEAITGLWGMTTVVSVWQFCWFLGVNPHGIISPIIEPLQLDGLLQNQAAIAAGNAPQYVFTNSFMFSFIQIGGSGGTIGLVLAIFMFSKRAEWRNTTKLSIIAILFSVNEPILFGIPIVLNPILFIPFMLGPIFVGILTYMATVNGFLGYTTVFVPQNTIPIFGGFASTRDNMAFLIIFINIVILTTLYSPFVLFANYTKKIDQMRNFKLNELPNLIIKKGLGKKNPKDKPSETQKTSTA